MMSTVHLTTEVDKWTGWTFVYKRWMAIWAHASASASA